MTTLAELHARAWKFTLAGEREPDRALELAAVALIEEARAEPSARSLIVAIYKKGSPQGHIVDSMCVEVGLDVDDVRAEAFGQHAYARWKAR